MLFIGGCADGEWHDVPEGVLRYSVPYLPPLLRLSSCTDGDEVPPFVSLEFSVSDYRLETLVAGVNRWSCFVSEDLPVDAWISKLLENYRPLEPRQA